VTRPAGLRWGIAGYGDVVIRRALPAFAALGQEVAGIWGRRRERAAEVARQFGAGRAFPCFAAMLDAVDAVYIATPVAGHEPLATAALEAGRHVLVEKPLGGGLPYDRARLAAAAAAGSLVSAVAYYRRLAPAWLAVRELARDRGPLRIAASFRARFAPGPGEPTYWRTIREISGGGVLADAGSHRIDILCWLLGRPVTSAASLDGYYPGGAERVARLQLSWADGSRARMTCEWAQSGQARDSVRITGSDLDIRLPSIDAGALSVRTGGVMSRRELPPEANPLVPMLRDFLSCVAAGGEPACSLADAMLVDEVIRSAAGGPAEISALRPERPL
jgi:predicted dehydrogenase